MSDRFDLPALDAALAGTPFAGQIRHTAETGSTNTDAMRAGVEGAAHGSVFLADAQTAGRGRGAHAWSSPAGSGLYVSVLLRLPLPPSDALWMSLAAGLASRAAVRAVAGFAPDLRWPNDLLAGARKLGGILTEMQAEATRVRFLVVGIGINVHQRAFPPELAGAATSLAIEAPDAAVSRQALLIALLWEIKAEIEMLTGNVPAIAQKAVLSRLEAGSSWVRGKRVTVGEAIPFSGVTEGLDARGFLLVRTDRGELRTVLSGAVREPRWERE